MVLIFAADRPWRWNKCSGTAFPVVEGTPGWLAFGFARAERMRRTIGGPGCEYCGGAKLRGYGQGSGGREHGHNDGIEIGTMRERALRLLAMEGTKFLIAGGISYIVHAVSLGVLYEFVFAGVDGALDTPFGELTLRLFLASAVAVEIAIIARFLLNDSWTFRDRRDKSFRRRFVQSNVTSLASPLLSVVCVNLLTPLLGGSYQVANAIGVLLGLAWDWTWSSRVVWRRPDAPLEPVEPVEVVQVR